MQKKGESQRPWELGLLQTHANWSELPGFRSATPSPAADYSDSGTERHAKNKSQSDVLEDDTQDNAERDTKA
jgi:hypothetical protein